MPELTVSQLTRQVKERIESAEGLRDVWVRGELSNIRLAGSGHLYFTLKDSSAQLKCAYFTYSRGKRQPPPDGQSALVHGDVRVYERNGEYQLIADDILLAGTGDLAARFEALKQKLAAEGLFDPARKKPLPAMPQRIAIVTSATTAALQDVLHVLRRRAPYLSTVLIHASVQGDAACPELVRALAAAQACPSVEAILLVRGGGSLEDLWCFNDEKLARAIAASTRPIVSGVGHEIDFTIADFAADHRAPTPSAAAELVAPDVAELRAGLDRAAARLARDAGRTLDAAGTALDRTFDRRVMRDVLGSLAAEAQTVDAWSETLCALAVQRTGLGAVTAAGGADPQLARLALPVAAVLERWGQRLPQLGDDLLHTSRRALGELAATARGLEHALTGLDPRRPKQLGWALVWAGDGTLVRDPATVAPGAPLRIEVQQGAFDAERRQS